MVNRGRDGHSPPEVMRDAETHDDGFSCSAALGAIVTA
jgi:hypothetical protein